MSRTWEVILSIASLVFVVAMFCYIIISVEFINGFYSYHEVEMNSPKNGYLYAIQIDGYGIWEKKIDEPIGVVLVYDGKDATKVNVYRFTDEVIGDVKLIGRGRTIYQIGDKYYWRMNIFERAF